MKHRILISVGILALAAGAGFTINKASAFGGPKLKPDLIVDQKRLLQNWVVRSENLPANFCSVIEGGITPGEHKLLRFTVSTPNIGTADVNLGDPNVHFEANDGLFELSTCHRHLHFRHYALYELIDPATGAVWRAAKRGFCMIDIEKYQDYPGPANNQRNYLSCGAPGRSKPRHSWKPGHQRGLGRHLRLAARWPVFCSGRRRWPGAGSSGHLQDSHHGEPAIYSRWG